MTQHESQLIDDYINGSDIDLGALESALLSSRELRDEFRRLTQLDTVLHLHHADSDYEIPTVSQEAFPSQRRGRFSKLMTSLSLSAIALGIIAIAVSFSLPAPPIVKVLATDTRPTIGTVLFQRESKLAETQRPLAEDSRISTGPLNLTEGSITLIFDGGCEITINAPTELTLLSANSAIIHRGELLFENNPMCDAFELTTPHSKLLDIGTMYSLSVNETSEDLQVQAGEVWRSSLARPQESCLVVSGKGYKTGIGVVSVEKVQSHDLVQSPPFHQKPPQIRQPYLVYDSFDYPHGQFEKKLESEQGVGWRGPWSWLSRDLEENELENSLVTFATSEAIVKNNTVMQRQLANVIDTRLDNTMYFAFDFEFKDLSEPDILFFRLFSSRDTEVRGDRMYELLLLGHQNRIVSRFGGTQSQEACEFKTKTTYRLIGKILSRKDGPDQIFISVAPASDPLSTKPPATWTTASRPIEFRSQFDFLTFHTYSKSLQSVKSVVVSDDWTVLREHYLALKETKKI